MLNSPCLGKEGFCFVFFCFLTEKCKLNDHLTASNLVYFLWFSLQCKWEEVFPFLHTIFFFGLKQSDAAPQHFLQIAFRNVFKGCWMCTHIESRFHFLAGPTGLHWSDSVRHFIPWHAHSVFILLFIRPAEVKNSHHKCNRIFSWNLRKPYVSFIGITESQWFSKCGS